MSTRLLAVARQEAARAWGALAGAVEATRVQQAIERRLLGALGALEATADQAEVSAAAGVVASQDLAVSLGALRDAGVQRVVLVSAHATGPMEGPLRAALAGLSAGVHLAIAATPGGDAGLVALRTADADLLADVPWGSKRTVGFLRDRVHEMGRVARSAGGLAAPATWEEALDALPRVSVVRTREAGTPPDTAWGDLARAAHGHGLALESIEVVAPGTRHLAAGQVARAPGESAWSAGVRAAEGAWVWLPHPAAHLDEHDVRRVAAYVARPPRPWARLEAPAAARGLLRSTRTSGAALRRRALPPEATPALLLRRALLDAVGGVGQGTHEAPDDLLRRLRRASRGARCRTPRGGTHHGERRERTSHG